MASINCWSYVDLIVSPSSARVFLIKPVYLLRNIHTRPGKFQTKGVGFSCGASCLVSQRLKSSCGTLTGPGVSLTLLRLQTRLLFDLWLTQGVWPQGPPGNNVKHTGARTHTCIHTHSLIYQTWVNMQLSPPASFSQKSGRSLLKRYITCCISQPVGPQSVPSPSHGVYAERLSVVQLLLFQLPLLAL